MSSRKLIFKKFLDKGKKTGKIAFMNTLKNHMKKYGLSLLEVSKMTGIPKHTVYAHSVGRRNIGARSAVKYSQGLGIGVEKLIRGVEDAAG